MYLRLVVCQLGVRGQVSAWNLLGTLTLSIMSSREAWSFSNVVKNTGREMFIEHGEDKDS